MKKLIIILTCLLIFFLAYAFFNSFKIKTETTIERSSKEVMQEIESSFYYNDSSMTTIKVPAVDKDGRGVMATITVDAEPGKGRTLVDINQILFWVDTQDSIRTAKIVAQNITGLDLTKYDIIYSIQANASAIEGPSAGAAMGIATILELENKTLNKNVTITGTLNEKGEIGKISGVLPKAEATKDVSMELLLVPLGQKTYTVYSEEKNCEDYLITKICRSTTKPKDVNIAEEAGIRIEEVSNIQEALKYFLT